LRNGPGFVASALGAITLPPHRYEGMSNCTASFCTNMKQLNPSHHRFTSSLQTASKDYYQDCFWAIQF